MLHRTAQDKKVGVRVLGRGTRSKNKLQSPRQANRHRKPSNAVAKRLARQMGAAHRKCTRVGPNCRDLAIGNWNVFNYDHSICKYVLKPNLHYTRGMMPKRETSGLAPEQHSSEETSQRWRAVGDTVSDSTGPRIEPQTSRIYSETLNNRANRQAHSKQLIKKCFSRSSPRHTAYQIVSKCGSFSTRRLHRIVYSLQA